MKRHSKFPLLASISDLYRLYEFVMKEALTFFCRPKNEGWWPRDWFSRPYLSDHLQYIHNMGYFKRMKILSECWCFASIHPFPTLDILIHTSRSRLLMKLHWNAMNRLMIHVRIWKWHSFPLKVQTKWHKELFRVWEGAELIFYYSFKPNK